MSSNCDPKELRVVAHEYLNQRVGDPNETAAFNLVRAAAAELEIAQRCMPHYNDLRNQLESLRSDNREMGHTIERLQTEIAEKDAVLARLPRTADGVTIVPGDTIWWHDMLREPISSEVDRTSLIRVTALNGAYIDARKSFSTRAAAEAANGGAT